VLGSALPAESLRLPPEPESCQRARHFVQDRISAWQLDALRDSAVLCATELATNAVLHSREPFVLTVRRAGDGVRIEVLDNCPHHLPISTPDRGSAVDLTSWGTAGRGMQIVANLAFRWGITTTDQEKSVWVEVREHFSGQLPEPILSLGHGPPPLAEAIALTFMDMPVRAAVASGIQTEEVIREIQLDQVSRDSGEPEVAARFFELVDRSAPVRLPGRHAALSAAADGRERFDLSLRCTADALSALAQLARALVAFESHRALPLPTLSDEVIAFRTWLDQEGARQRAGDRPSACPLP
jgi:hypothetical protein